MKVFYCLKTSDILLFMIDENNEKDTRIDFYTYWKLIYFNS